jgi:hypothetical protein
MGAPMFDLAEGDSQDEADGEIAPGDAGPSGRSLSTSALARKLQRHPALAVSGLPGVGILAVLELTIQGIHLDRAWAGGGSYGAVVKCGSYWCSIAEGSAPVTVGGGGGGTSGGGGGATASMDGGEPWRVTASGDSLELGGDADVAAAGAPAPAGGGLQAAASVGGASAASAPAWRGAAPVKVGRRDPLLRRCRCWRAQPRPAHRAVGSVTLPVAPLHP